MTVYVDEFKHWAPADKAKPLCFAHGSCHMTTDGDLSELHALATKIGLRRAWFQDGMIPHYDLTASRREAALSNGAVFMPAREQAARRIYARRQKGEQRV